MKYKYQTAELNSLLKGGQNEIKKLDDFSDRKQAHVNKKEYICIKRIREWYKKREGMREKIERERAGDKEIERGKERGRRKKCKKEGEMLGMACVITVIMG